MKKMIMTLIAGVACHITVGAGFPQISVQDWNSSLDIVDVDNKAATLDYACVINSKVGGSVPSHDSSYNNWRMEFIVKFDRAIKKNGVSMYGQIHSNNGAWTLINWFTSDKKNNCWHPVHMPATAAGASTELISTMLNPSSAENAYAVYYSTFSFSKPYGISFVDWIGEFYCGIAFHSREYLGTTCTIDVVLINPSDSSDRRTLSTITYRYDRGMYKDSDPGQWFNARIGWWEQLPKDYSRCVNCEVLEDEEDSISMKELGKVDFDGDATFHVLTNKWERRSAYRKKLEVEIEGGQSLAVKTFDEMLQQADSSVYGGTVSCALYAEDGTTNLMAFVKKPGENANEYRKLVPERQLDLGEYAKFTVSIIKRLDETFAEYQVNGIRCLLDGESTLPVAMQADENKLRMIGSAVLTDVYGDLEREPHGKAIIFQ